MRAYIRVINNPEFHEQSESWKEGIAQSIPSILNLYNYNKIYFAKTTCEGLDNFLRMSEDITHKIMILDSVDIQKNSQKIQDELESRVKKWILPLKENLEQDFRELLGVEMV